ESLGGRCAKRSCSGGKPVRNHPADNSRYGLLSDGARMKLCCPVRDRGPAFIRVALATVCAGYLGALVYIFPTQHDQFGHWVFERNVFAAVCAVAWVALEVGLARLGSGHPVRRLVFVSTVLLSTVASLPWALAVLRGLRTTIGLAQILPGNEPA